jgi:hypothetical protein
MKILEINYYVYMYTGYLLLVHMKYESIYFSDLWIICKQIFIDIILFLCTVEDRLSRMPRTWPALDKRFLRILDILTKYI